jgi:methylenetetrahydrofolate reductase (NADPH)
MKVTAASRSTVAMLDNFSIELIARDSRAVDAAADRLDPGAVVSLTWIPGSNPMEMISAATRLKRAGLVPMPHIGARHLESAAQLEKLAGRLIEDAGVDRILLIGGDRSSPAGPYDSTLAVMQTEIFQKAVIHRIAVAGFPEGNPHISAHVLSEALTAKVNFARKTGLQLSIVTQFAFDAEPIIKWLHAIRARGIDVPVRVGLAGPAGLITLVRYALRCGIGNSLHVLTENPSFAKALVEQGPEPIIRELAAAAECDPALEITGLHFYTFGGFQKTMDWIHALRTFDTASVDA